MSDVVFIKWNRRDGIYGAEKDKHASLLSDSVVYEKKYERENDDAYADDLLYSKRVAQNRVNQKEKGKGQDTQKAVGAPVGQRKGDHGYIRLEYFKARAQTEGWERLGGEGKVLIKNNYRAE